MSNMWTLWQDLRYSARLLGTHPGFTLTAVGVLTLGIGVNAGVFGIINGLMIRPLAGADAPGEVVGVFSKDRTAARDYRPFSYPGFSDVRDAGGPFAHLAGHTVALAGVTENNTTRQATVDIVTTGFFETLGVQPVYGRDFTMDEERPGTAARSVIVSYKVWERSGLDRGILKQTVRINGQDFAIVGVAPQHFTGTTAILGAEYYMPVGVHDAIASDFDADGRFPISDRRSRPLILVGRLKPGVTRDQADARLKVIAAAHEQAYPDDNKNQDLVVGTLDRLDISTRPQDDTQIWVPMGILQGLAATVLLTSCMNLANMMLAFGSARQKEIAIRLAIGGTRSRIVRQLLVQGLMLSLAGGALGLLTATWAAQLLVSSMATVFPIFLALDLTPDTTVLFATMIFCSLATVAFGLGPALRLSRPALVSSLKDHAGEISGKIAGRITVRDALVTAQLALSLALLVLSGLFVRGAAAGASANPGFDVGQLAIAQIEPTLGGYDAAQAREAHRAVLERLRSTPGIESVAEASVLPFGDYSFGAAVQREGPRLKNEDPEAAGKLLDVQTYTVTSDYFRTLGLTMVRGREFTAAEEAAGGGTTPVIIDVTLAEPLFANENPVGQSLQYGADSGTADSNPMVIVGLAPAVKHDLFKNRPEAHLYLPSGRFHAHVRLRARRRTADRGCDREERSRTAASHRSQPAGDLREELPCAARRQRARVGPSRRRKDVPDAWSCRHLCGGDWLVWRAQLPGLAPHPRVRRAHGDRRVARRRAEPRRSRNPGDHHRRTHDWPGPRHAARLGIACSDLSDQPVRSGDSGSRHRDSWDLVARGVNHSGSTGC
jgi:predicted permease